MRDSMKIYGQSERINNMFQLTDICQYIKSKIDVGEGITAGIISEKSNKCIGVYDNNRSESPRMALGGVENIRYCKKKISILVHWGASQQNAQKKAYEIYSLFLGKTDINIGISHIAFFVPYAPQCVGFTGDKIYEYVVPVEIYINKEANQ